LYYLPFPTFCHETGSPFEGASKGLRDLAEIGFAYYDMPTESVWVPEMARIQIGNSLLDNDKRIKGIKKDLEKSRMSPFFNEFLDKYMESFHLHDVARNEAPSKPLRSPSEAPSKPRSRSRAVSGAVSGAGAGAVQPSAGALLPTGMNGHGKAPTTAVWTAYCVAYKLRYKTEPVRNATINGQLARFLARVSANEAPMIAAAYVGNNAMTYVRAGHSVGLLLRDAEKLRTEWATGLRTTESKARELDHLQGQGDDWKDLLGKAKDASAQAES
jgi:hypothetical protein